MVYGKTCNEKALRLCVSARESHASSLSHMSSGIADTQKALCRSAPSRDGPSSVPNPDSIQVHLGHRLHSEPPNLKIQV
jgi:hypothetical protein